MINSVQNLSIALLMSPLVSSLLVWFGRKYLNNKIISVFSLFCVGISVLISIYFLHGFFIKNFSTMDGTWYVWAKSGGIQFKFGFLLDKLNIAMLSLVSIMSLIIQIYSVGYMRDDLSYARFFSYISFFTFSMLLLVIANNFFQLFVGWELIGLGSYLLINFWFKQELANLAAFKAFVINRIGDCGLLLGIAAILKWCGSLDYIVIFKNLPQSLDAINIICGLLFLGAMAKSAQIPLHSWLPDAMQGPMPVSALIHSATMVTAGVFMLARISPILEHSKYWLNIILLIGVLTYLLIGMLAIMENDIKKILAYSTISQLGLMMVAIGASAYTAGIFHLINHAVFKSLLFLAVGSIWYTLIASFSISGFPGFAGFFSKALIIESIQLSNLPFAKNAYYLLLFGGIITAFYSFKLVFIILFDKKIIKTTKTKKSMNIPMIILAVLSVILSGLIMPITNNKFVFLHNLMSCSVMCALLGIIIACVLYKIKPNLSDLIIVILKNNFLFFYKLLKHQYFFNALNKLVIIIFRGVARILSEIIDKVIIDKILINGSTNIIIYCSKIIQKIHTGYLYNYLFFMLSGVLIILLWLILTTS